MSGRDDGWIKLMMRQGMTLKQATDYRTLLNRTLPDLIADLRQPDSAAEKEFDRQMAKRELREFESRTHGKPGPKPRSGYAPVARHLYECLGFRYRDIKTIFKNSGGRWLERADGWGYADNGPLRKAVHRDIAAGACDICADGLPPEMLGSVRSMSPKKPVP